MTSEPVWVVGAGGHGKVVVDALRAAGVSIAGVLDSDASRRDSRVLGYAVEAPYDDATLVELAVRSAILAIGDNRLRFEEAKRLRARVSWAVAMHPAAIVASSAQVDEGAVVCAGAVVQADSQIGAHAIVNTSASVDHDCVVGQAAHIAPGCRLAGGVYVGEGTLLGIGSVVTPGVRIGTWCVVGAGSVVISDVPSGATVVGSPAHHRASGPKR